VGPLRRRDYRALLAAVLVALAGGCTTASTPIPALTLPSSTSMAPSPATDFARSVTSPSGNPTVPPQRATVPDGSYRVRVTSEEIVARGTYEIYLAGTWTLTFDRGEYRLVCHPISDPSEDCGRSGPTTNTRQVEFGHLRGLGNTVWFLDLQQAGTDCPTGQTANNGCKPIDPYGFRWNRTPHGLVFTDFVGLGNQAGRPGEFLNYTLKAWTQIA
jgi:hypothetical protein